MPNTFITGTTGSGKSLYAIQRVKDYLLAGRRVVTNLDIFLHELMPEDCKATLTRLPDIPRSIDLYDMGKGYEGKKVDKKKTGLLVLDECSIFLNSRQWNDKDRKHVLAWLMQVRKHRWDIMFITQDLEALDGKAVTSLLHKHVMCLNLENVPVPLLGHLGVKFPTSTKATIYAGRGSSAMKEGTELFIAKEYYPCYDTEQEFEVDYEWLNDKEVDMRASYTVLSSYHMHRIVKQPDTKPIHAGVLELIQKLNNHLPRQLGYQTVWER